MRVAAGLLVLTALSVALRTGALDAGYWIDEAIAVGIASHEPAEIPALLRQDGSPPLYYLLLHAWIGMFGDGEAATRSLSLLFAALAVPAAWWAERRRRPARRRGRGRHRRRLPVRRPLRAGGADVHARGRAVAGGGGRLRPAAPGHSRGRARPAALHAHVGRLPGRRPRTRVAGAAPRPGRGDHVRRRRAGCTCRGCRASCSRPSTPARRGRHLRRSSTSCRRRSPWRGARATSSCSRAPPGSRSPGSPRRSSPRGRRATPRSSSGRCCWCSRAVPRGSSRRCSP